tara:strand:+ start:357 stop:1070 length:714 start_codon:yes stop_codon:yes gene_type:complete
MVDAPNPAHPVSFFLCVLLPYLIFFDFQKPRKVLPAPPKKPSKRSRRSKKVAPKSPEEAKKAKEQLAQSQLRKAAVKHHEMDPLVSVYPKLTQPAYNAIMDLYGSKGIRGANMDKYNAGDWYRSLSAPARKACLDLFAKLMYICLCEYEYRGFAGSSGIWSNLKKIIWTYNCIRTKRTNATRQVDWMDETNFESVLAYSVIVIFDKLYFHGQFSKLTKKTEKLSKQHPLLRGNVIYM